MFRRKIDTLQGAVYNESDEEKQSIAALRFNTYVCRSRCTRIYECLHLGAHPDICVGCFQEGTHLGMSVRGCEFAQGFWGPQVRQSRG